MQFFKALAAFLAINAGAAIAASAQAGWQPRDVAYSGMISVHVDATDVDRGIFRVSEVVPVQGGHRITLLFPKWVPGNHAATARVERLAGLVITAGQARVAWERDAVDMNAFHVNVPAGAAKLSLRFDYLSATNPDDGRVVMTPEMLNLQWFSLLLYPAGYFARDIDFDPEVTLPADWQFATQMEVASRAGPTIHFQPLSLEALMDAPLFAGRYFRRFPLGMVGGVPYQLNAVADDPKYLQPAPGAIDAHQKLVAEAGAVFGPPPFHHYDFLLALTDRLGGIGTEHLASSENTRDPDYLSDWTDNGLLAHELVHAWNGKARRPADLWTADFNLPMRNSMLWVYEGQTQFWGFVLAARSGLMTQGQVLDVFARLAAIYSTAPSRTWRPLADTGNEAIMSRELVNEPWPSWHGAMSDSYSLALLVWLQADATMRNLSGGRRGLEDFARTFFQGGGERPSLYRFEDVVDGLQRIQPYDWKGFLIDHLTDVEHPRTDWLRYSGYRLVYAPAPTAEFTEHEKRVGRIDLTSSIGLMLAPGSSGKIRDVVWGSPAFEAKLVRGATIAGVDGKSYAPRLLLKAIADHRTQGVPIRLLISNGERRRTVELDYHGGLRFPRLERVPEEPDRLGELLRAKTEASR